MHNVNRCMLVQSKRRFHRRLSTNYFAKRESRWTGINSSCNRRRISVSLEAWWAVDNLARDVGLG